MVKRGILLGVLVVAMVAALAGCGGVEGGESSTVEAPRTGMQAIHEAEAAGATPDCSRYPVWMECR